MKGTHVIPPTLEELEGRSLPAVSLVGDINPGSRDSDPAASEFIEASAAVVNGAAFFFAESGSQGRQLWKSDGTPSGTVHLKDVFQGRREPGGLVDVGGTLFFQSPSDITGDLWKSDGTTAGTVLIKQIDSGNVSGAVLRELTNVNGTVFFNATSGALNYELWKSDGTEAGTVLVKDIDPVPDDIVPLSGRPGGNPINLTNVNGTLFFSADDGVHGYELWKSDGTEAGTVLVKDIQLTGYGSSPSMLTNINGTLFLTASDDEHGIELWKSDGTEAGTVLVKDIYPGYGPSQPDSLAILNGTLFFTADDGVHGRELWRSDGTEAGTVLVKDIFAGTPPYSPLPYLTNLNGTLFFQAYDAANGFELWKSDGTEAGTVMVKDINPGSRGSYMTRFTNVNGTLFFTANDGVHGIELWQSDGTAAGTVLARDIRPGSASSYPGNFIAANSRLLFAADDGVHGVELWTATPGPTVTGAHIREAAFSGAGGSFDAVRLTFSEAMDASSFTAADVTLTGPGGAFSPTSVTPVPGTSDQLDVTFAPQTAPGIYSIRTGVDILTATGQRMDQNENGTGGETPADEFMGAGVLGTPRVPPLFAVGGADGSVRLLNADTGSTITTFRPLDFGATPYTGVVEVAVGDLNGDGVPDVFVSAASPLGAAGLSAGKAGQVLALDGADLLASSTTPTVLRLFTPFRNSDGPAGDVAPYTNGLNIAVADVNGDGKADLIAGTRGGTGGPGGGNREIGRLAVIDGTSGTSVTGENIVIGGIQKPFGGGYEKGVVVAAGNADGLGGAEIAVTRGGPVASPNPETQKIKVKVMQFQGSSLRELPLSADGATAFAPFGGLPGPASTIRRDGRVAFADEDGDGKAELVFSALDPLTNAANEQVRVGVYSINPTVATGAATVVSTGSDSGTYLTGSAVADHAIAHAAATGSLQTLALLTESAASGIAFLAPLTGEVLGGGISLSIVTGGITIDGI